ncbi:MAG: radical SAM protein [Deltaproteobacteria bacterium]|nr:radical SAM protein [Deltaproteobacteria bacterium]
MPLLDIIVGYDCNLACDYCTITPEMRERSLGTRAVVEALRRGPRDGYDRVSFTGGEPTIRGDLLPLVREARRLGYADIKVQSNGLLFTEANVARLIDAGCNRFHISVHTHREDRYDGLVRRDGAYALMVEGLDAVVRAVRAGADAGRDDLHLTVDLIIKADTLHDLPDAVRWLHGRGVRSVHLWFVSLTDHNRENLASLPRMTDAVPQIAEALRFADAEGFECLSLHVPRCLVGEELLAHVWDPAAQGVRVVTPDATFQLDASKITGQVHVPACEGCEHRDVCPGLREDYLDVYGDAEVVRARGLG